MRRNPPIRRLGAFAAAASFLPAVIASSTPAPSDVPAVDFGRMGSVGVGGAFAGLDWFSAQSPFASGSNSTASTSYSHDGDSLIMRNADGTVTVLGSTNAGGSIVSICWADQGANGTLYVGGSFSSISSTNSPNIIAYSVADSKFIALGTGLSGAVETVYCDDTHKEVWAGGEFSAPTGSGGNVARWSSDSSTWNAVPFGGLNGRVDSISSSTDGNSLYFGGAFTTQYADSSNTSAFVSLASISIAPPNTVTTGNSGYFTPFTIPAAASQYGGLDVDASPGSDNKDHNQAGTLLCPGNGTWFARDKSIATVNILAHAFLPIAGVRIANGRLDGRAVKSFTLTTLPDNTVRQLLYTDPKTGKNETCNPRCDLSTDSNVWAQDFLFDSLVNTTGLHITLNTWEGESAALEYVQVLSNGAYASYVASDNDGLCGKSNTTVLEVGNWANKTAPSDIAGTEIGYMSASVPTTKVEDTSLTLYPYVGSAGYYDISLVIPGCANIGDCAGRTTVDVAVFPQQGGLPWTMTVDQRVQTDTTVLIYSGLVDASSPAFSPTIHVALPANPASISAHSYVVVASGVQLTLTGLSDGTESPYESPSASTGISTSRTRSGQSGGTQTGGNPQPTGTNASGGGSDTSSGGSGGSPSGTGSTESGGIIVGTSTNGGASQSGSNQPSQSGTGQSGTSTGSPGASSSGTPTTASSASISPPPFTTSHATRVAFGVYEWSRNSNAQVNAANSVLANSTETALTHLGFALDVAFNASTSKDFAVNTITTVNGSTYVGGKFVMANSFSNVVAIDSSGASSLSNHGLNGPVHTAVGSGNHVYFGGEFTETSQGGTVLKYLAQYDPSAKTWAAVGGGVDGPVADMVAVPGGFVVTGNFSNVIHSNGTTVSTGGYAVYNATNNDWASSGIIYGTGAAAGGHGDNTYLGGRFLGSSRNAVNGVASLVLKDGVANIEAVPGVGFSSSPRSTSTPARRSLSGLLGSVRRALRLRADPPAIPAEQPQEAPATLAGAYWTNSSAHGKPKITIIGGNFTSGSIAGVAYQSAGSMTGPPPVSGIVRALSVVDSKLFVGGSNVSVDGVGSGVIMLDLTTNTWVKDGMQSLVSTGGGSVDVSAIKQQNGKVVVAGNFASAASFPCAAVCIWDTKQSSPQWAQPGKDATISFGEVRSVDFGDPQLGTLVAGGSFTLGGNNVYAAQYSFAENTWTALGSLPGPVLAIAVNDKNLSSIFAAGVDGSQKPYLQHWDGKTWTDQNSTALQPGTKIQQLAFVPLQKEHQARGSIENNRMLMTSGDVILADSGNVSSALYDGAQWHPYLVGSTNTGTLGSISSLFWSDSGFSFSLRKYLARGLVVLVAMAIATGLILILILLILLGAYCLRRHERKQQPQDVYDDKDGASDVSSTHRLIHNSVQTALQRSLMQPPPAHLVAGGARDSGDSNDVFVHQYDDASDEGRETVMRYDFFGPELQSGELPMRAGQRVIVLDDEQSEEWWYCRDPETQREGVVPATYVCEYLV